MSQILANGFLSAQVISSGFSSKTAAAIVGRLCFSATLQQPSIEVAVKQPSIEATIETCTK